MIQKLSSLAYFLKIPLEDLNYLAEHSEQFYYEKKEQKLKNDGSPKLKNGRVQYRVINPSKGKLKLIQGRIKNILAKIALPKNIKGGVKGEDNISNAKTHKGKKYHFCTDLTNFFPSVTNKMVYESFFRVGFSQDVSRSLTRLTTYKGHLPQGTPTSTHIANLVFLSIDEKLIELCNPDGIIYTRYIDDLNFSCQRDFKDKVQPIVHIIEDGGFNIAHRKTAYKGKPVLVTGILVKHNSLNARDDQLERLLREDISEESKKGLEKYIYRVQSN